MIFLHPGYFFLDLKVKQAIKKTYLSFAEYKQIGQIALYFQKRKLKVENYDVNSKVSKTCINPKFNCIFFQNINNKFAIFVHLPMNFQNFN